VIEDRQPTIEIRTEADEATSNLHRVEQIILFDFASSERRGEHCGGEGRLSRPRRGIGIN
jgi:hypothetical protein